MTVITKELASKDQVTMQKELARETHEELKPKMKKMGFNVPPKRVYAYTPVLENRNLKKHQAAEEHYKTDPKYCPCGAIIPYELRHLKHCSERCKLFFTKHKQAKKA